MQIVPKRTVSGSQRVAVPNKPGCPSAPRLRPPLPVSAPWRGRTAAAGPGGSRHPLPAVGRPAVLTLQQKLTSPTRERISREGCASHPGRRGPAGGGGCRPAPAAGWVRLWVQLNCSPSYLQALLFLKQDRPLTTCHRLPAPAPLQHLFSGLPVFAVNYIFAKDVRSGLFTIPLYDD